MHQPAGGAASLGILEALGSQESGEALARLPFQRPLCLPSDPRHHLELAGAPRSSVGRVGGRGLRERAGRKGLPASHTPGVLCCRHLVIRKRRQRAVRDPQDPSRRRRVGTQAPSQQPPDILPRPVPLCGPALFVIWTLNCKGRSQVKRKEKVEQILLQRPVDKCL